MKPAKISRACGRHRSLRNLPSAAEAEATGSLAGTVQKPSAYKRKPRAAMRAR